MDNKNVYSDTQRKREKRKNETPEQREVRRLRDRERKREKRAAETTEEREMRLTSIRNLYQKRRKQENESGENNVNNGIIDSGNEVNDGANDREW
ncbi:9305_t:CDS:1, partial [Racocetra persica]